MKPYIPPAINPTLTFDLYGRAGRDDIATQIKKDVDSYCEQTLLDERRTHLGISEIGHNCVRYVWYKFRWMVQEKFDGRMARLFQRGHRFETVAIEILNGIGFTIESHTIDGKQIHVARSIGGHYGGSIDSNTRLPIRYGNFPDRLLVEYKTANKDWFAKISTQGFIKGKPHHWAQACSYGRKLNLRYILYICEDKNDDDWDVELEELDWEFAEEQERKAEFIILSNVPPRRLSETPSYYECRYCPAQQVCHFSATPDKNCRSCQYAQPVDDGQWFCHNYQQNIPTDFIAKGCEQWTPLTA